MGEKSRGVSFTYPERQRCFKCRKLFGPAVLLGIYCSTECAGILVPSRNPEDWPRCHYRLIPHSNNKRLPKKDWITRDVAEAEAKRWGKTAYICEYCLRWHIGSSKPGVAYRTDVVVLTGRSRRG